MTTVLAKHSRMQESSKIFVEHTLRVARIQFRICARGTEGPVMTICVSTIGFRIRKTSLTKGKKID